MQTHTHTHILRMLLHSLFILELAAYIVVVVGRGAGGSTKRIHFGICVCKMQQ